MRRPGGQSTFIDDEDFKFISASVSSLTSHMGTNNCGPLGKAISKTTLAFNPDEIRTLYDKPYNTICTYTLGTHEPQLTDTRPSHLGLPQPSVVALLLCRTDR
ncbi:hypothetical protein BDV96DRAFT_604287 [Lophiotrema nucula]|uniref:Uncharacterized protein n=1 Tax=Lophiotrema nucula TaxID=690887 RepID=A0A6A5YT68_9PLEO|nr:hypothetical protein BDV96DRAFT_604287 [Lophiotrema nucula]